MSDIHSDIYKIRRTAKPETSILPTRFGMLAIAITLMILTMIGVVVYNAAGWPGIASFLTLTLICVGVDRAFKPKS